MSYFEKWYEKEIVDYLTKKLNREPTMREVDEEIYNVNKEYNWIKYPKDYNSYCSCGDCEWCDDNG